MVDEFPRLFLLPLAGGLVGIVATAIFCRRHETVQRSSNDHHPTFNVHAWYVAGIIGFLLVCSLAVDWGSIPELATILSFAVGLASLILAMIAIIQSLTSTGNVETALGAVRRAAEDAAKSGAELTVSVSAIREASQNAQSASSAALRVTEALSDVSTAVLKSGEEGRLAINSLREEIKSNLKYDSSKERETVPNGVDEDIFKNGVTLGGATATYAAIRAFETGKSFSWKELLPEAASTYFENGYIAALDDLGLITMSRDENLITVLEATDELIASRDSVTKKKFAGEKEKLFDQSMDAVDLYFGPVE